MKYIRQIILFIVVSILIILISIFYIVSANNNYEKKLIKEIKKNYTINEEIEKVNKYDNNYIITTKTKIIVLNKKYKNIKEEDINKLASNLDNYTLIYKNNKLMYENTIIKKDKVIYEYYDAYTYEYQDNTILEE
jgi:hypothetical protein